MRRIGWCLLIVSWATLAHAQDGAGLHAEHCSRCHDGGLPRVPARRVLSGLEPERILASLETGTMRTQGAERTAGEKRAIAAFLTGKTIGDSPAPPAPKMCSTTPPADTSWNGWGVSENQCALSARDRRETLRRRRRPAESEVGVRLCRRRRGRGAAEHRGTPRARGERHRDRSTRWIFREGCVYWTYEADAKVRTAVALGTIGGIQAGFFGDVGGTVYSVDVMTGRLRWKRKVDEHPVARVTGTPTLHEGRLYVPVSSGEEFVGADPKYPCCTFRGSVVALDAASGEVAWKTYVIPESAEADPHEQDWDAALRTVGSRHLVVADGRREDRHDLRRHRRQLFRSGGGDERRDHRARCEDRDDQMVAADDERRRLQPRLCRGRSDELP